MRPKFPHIWRNIHEFFQENPNDEIAVFHFKTARMAYSFAEGLRRWRSEPSMDVYTKGRDVYVRRLSKTQ